MRTNITVHPPADRPDVLAEVDGEWCVAEVRMQWQEGDVWWAQVQYRPPGEHTRRFINVPADRVRPDETDYSARPSSS